MQSDTGIADLIKRLREMHDDKAANREPRFSPEWRAALAGAADALEAAERVIEPFAVEGEHVKRTLGRADTWLRHSLSLKTSHVLAASDWLARHATTQRQGGDDE